MVQRTCYKIRPLNCAVLSTSGGKTFFGIFRNSESFIVLKVLAVLLFPPHTLGNSWHL